MLSENEFSGGIYHPFVKMLRILLPSPSDSPFHLRQTASIALFQVAQETAKGEVYGMPLHVFKGADVRAGKGNLPDSPPLFIGISRSDMPMTPMRASIDVF